jgi:hypothetical protein
MLKRDKQRPGRSKKPSEHTNVKCENERHQKRTNVIRSNAEVQVPNTKGKVGKAGEDIVEAF